MLKNKFVGVAALVTFALGSQASAFAGVLSLEPSGRVIDGVAISKSGVINVAGRTTALSTVGAGTRAKRVVVIDVKVYVAQLLLSDAAKYARTPGGALASASTMQSAAIRLNFVHAVSADQIQGAFRDSFDANDVDQNAAGVRDFLNLVRQGRDASSGQSLTIVLEKLADGGEAVTYEDTQGVAHTIAAPTGTMRSILAIWLGTPADDGLAKLKTGLIGG